MRKKFKNIGILACLAILFLFVSQLSAPWQYNPFTRKLDYYAFNVGGALVGEANGDILYYNGTVWTNLPVGANTNVLTVAAGVPVWAAGAAPGAHAASHEVGGADLVDHDVLTNFVAAEHLLVGAIDHDSLLNYVAGDHIGLPNTIATVLSDWDADLDTYAGITPSANIQTYLGAANYAAMRTQLGLVIGTNVQAWDTDLDTYAGISPSANMQSFLDDANFATMRTTIGLAIGTNVQAWDADLDTYAGITPSANVQTLLANATFALFMADLSGTAAAQFDWGGQNLANVGSIAPTSIDCGGVITAASYIAIEDTNELRFYDDGNYVGFEPGALEANQIWVLPIADGANTQVMQTDGAGTLTWVANASGSMASDALWAAQGDLAYGNADDVGVILSFNYEGDILRLNATVPYWDTPGIANTNPVVIDDDNVADDEYARFTASGLESRTAAEVLSNIGAQPLNTVLTELTALTDPGADEFPFWNDTTNNFEFSTVLFPTATGITVGAAGNAGKLELEDADADVLAIQVGVQAGNTTYTWPTAFGTTGFVLSSTDAGVMSWVSNTSDAFTVKVDAGAAADYLGVAAGDGVLRTSNSIGWTDGGNFVTLDVTEANVDHDALSNFVTNEHINWEDTAGVADNFGTSGFVALHYNAEVRFYDNGNYVGFEAPALGANQIWVLPNADGAAGQFLKTDAAGNLGWAAAAGGGTMTTVEHGDAGVGGADIITLDFLAADFVIGEAPDTEINISLDYPNAQKATTAQAGFLTELTTTAEVSAGVDTTRAVTADALAGSTIGRKSMIWKLTANDEVIVDQDDYDSILVPADFAGWLITGVAARIVTADDGADFLDVGIYNVTQTAEILSTLMRIEAGEWSTLTSAQPGVIDAAEDDITAGDVIRIDVDYAGDNCTGLEVHITFERVT